MEKRWSRRHPSAPPALEREDAQADEQAAYAVAAWLQRADRNGSLESYFNPPLTGEEQEVADVEGWILGVV